MNSQEDISNLYTVLYQNENWLNRSIVRTKQLDAIKRLGFYGDSQSIYALVRFLNHDSQEIRTATINSIKNLFNKFDSKSAYESSLRHCNILIKDIRQYIKNYSSEDLKYPLAIASINSNGYVREEALKYIFKNDLSDSLIQFVIYRLGDWVSQVRKSAQINYEKVLDDGKWESIINHLDLIFWLKKVQRVDLSETFDRTIKFLTTENAEETYKTFSKLTEKTRFKLTQEILKIDPINQLAQKTFSIDKSYLVRSKLAESIHRIENREELITIFKKDKSGIVRQKCLESRIKIETERSKIDFKELLFDRSATIRNLAQFYLALTKEEILELYKNGIANIELRETSIYGIGELGSKTDVELLLPFVNSENNKIKKAAIRTILKLDSGRITSQLIKELDSNNKSIRKLAIEHLSGTASDEILNRCREIFSKGDKDVKLSMLSFFGRNCSYKTLPDLILALNESDEEITNSAWSHLEIWRTKSISIYTKQTDSDKVRAEEIYNQIKFKNKMPYAREKLWNELPYFGRFKVE
jgi:HEAT repeat protein